MKMYLPLNLFLGLIFLGLANFTFADSDPFADFFVHYDKKQAIKAENSVNQATNDIANKVANKAESVCSNYAEVKFPTQNLADFHYKGFSKNIKNNQISYEFFFLHQDKIVSFRLTDVFTNENLRLDKVVKNKLIVSKYKQCVVSETLEWAL